MQESGECDLGHVFDNMKTYLKYIDANGLSNLNNDLPFFANPGTLLSIVVSTLTAMRRLHEKGFLHRDFKCNNVILVPACIKIREVSKRLAFTDFFTVNPNILEPTATEGNDSNGKEKFQLEEDACIDVSVEPFDELDVTFLDKYLSSHSSGSEATTNAIYDFLRSIGTAVNENEAVLLPGFRLCDYGMSTTIARFPEATKFGDRSVKSGDEATSVATEVLIRKREQEEQTQDGKGSKEGSDGAAETPKKEHEIEDPFDYDMYYRSPPKYHEGGRFPQVYSICYRPPELLFASRNYGRTVESWSYGLFFLELLRIIVQEHKIRSNIKRLSAEATEDVPMTVEMENHSGHSSAIKHTRQSDEEVHALQVDTDAIQACNNPGQSATATAVSTNDESNWTPFVRKSPFDFSLTTPDAVHSEKRMEHPSGEMSAAKRTRNDGFTRAATRSAVRGELFTPEQKPSGKQTETPGTAFNETFSQKLLLLSERQGPKPSTAEDRGRGSAQAIELSSAESIPEMASDALSAHPLVNLSPEPCSRVLFLDHSPSPGPRVNREESVSGKEDRGVIHYRDGPAAAISGSMAKEDGESLALARRQDQFEGEEEELYHNRLRSEMNRNDGFLFGGRSADWSEAPFAQNDRDEFDFFMNRFYRTRPDPEPIKKRKYSPLDDLTQPLFGSYDSSELEVLSNVFERFGPPTANVWPTASELPGFMMSAMDCPYCLANPNTSMVSQSSSMPSNLTALPLPRWIYRETVQSSCVPDYHNPEKEKENVSIIEREDRDSSSELQEFVQEFSSIDNKPVFHMCALSYILKWLGVSIDNCPEDPTEYYPGTKLPTTLPRYLPLCVDFAVRMLALDPEKRIDMAQALRHPLLFSLASNISKEQPHHTPIIAPSVEDAGMKEVIIRSTLLLAWKLQECVDVIDAEQEKANEANDRFSDFRTKHRNDSSNIRSPPFSKLLFTDDDGDSGGRGLLFDMFE